MSAAPRLATPQQQATAGPHQDVLRLLDLIGGDQQGYMELCWIDGDPSDRTSPFGRRWRPYSRERAANIARELANLARRYGNVYVSSTLYDRPARPQNGGVPLASRIVFIDDAPAHPSLPYSAVVRTSEHSRHGYMILEQPEQPAIRRELQQRLAAGLGADPSGADIEQIVRVPESWNTKRGGRYPVWLEVDSMRTYTVAELRAHFPQQVAPAGAAPAGSDAGPLWQEAETILANIGQLLTRDKLPRRLKNPNGQSRRVLEGREHIASKTGEVNTSDDRACVARGLIMHGYPDAEAAALLFHLCDYGTSDMKGTAWLQQDIARLIRKERARQASIQPTPSRLQLDHPAQAVEQKARTSRARQDRPHRLDACDLLAWYADHIDASGCVFMTRQEVAQELSISLGTLGRLERDLRASGAIERRTSRDRSHSWVAVLGVINMPAQAPESASEEVRSAPGRIIDARTYEREHTAPGIPLPDPPAPLPSPAAAAPGGLTIDDADLSDRWGWEQEPAFELPKRKRVKRPALETLPIAEQIAELKRRRRALQGKKSQAKFIGHDSMFFALERQAADLRIRIEGLEREVAAAALAAPPAPATQLGIEDAPTVVPMGACVPPTPPATVMSRPPVDFFAPPEGYSSEPLPRRAERAPTLQEVNAYQAALLEAQGQHERAAFIRRAWGLPGAAQ